jgi:hypothetical protein
METAQPNQVLPHLSQRGFPNSRLILGWPEVDFPLNISWPYTKALDHTICYLSSGYQRTSPRQTCCYGDAAVFETGLATKLGWDVNCKAWEILGLIKLAQRSAHKPCCSSSLLILQNKSFMHVKRREIISAVDRCAINQHLSRLHFMVPLLKKFNFHH